MTTQKYGQNHDEVARYIEQIKNLTPEQIRQVAAAADAAAAAAYDAAADAAAAAAAYDAAAADAAAAGDAAAAAYDAAAGYWNSRWYLRRGAFALAIKHLIGTKGFTQAHYDRLTAPVRLLESFQVKEEPAKAVSSKYSFDRKNFAFTTDDVSKLCSHGIITTLEARYLIGLES